MLEKLKNLTEEQKQKLNTLATAEEVSAFAKEAGIDLTQEEVAEIANRLPDDALEGVAGGNWIAPPSGAQLNPKASDLR